MLTSTPGRAAFGVALFLAAVATATAGSFSVNPVRATLSTARTSESLTVRNNGAEAAVIQLEVVAWAHEGEKDVLTPTRELLATPPIFTLPPGGTQVIRVGLRRAPDPRRELTYRLFLQEVPQAPKAGFQGLQVALRLSVPVFVDPPVPAAPALRWHVSTGLAGQVRVSATNEGNAHVQIANFEIAAGGSSVLPRQHVAAYVLPGQTRHFVVRPARVVAPGTALRLSAATDSGDVHADIMVDKR